LGNQDVEAYAESYYIKGDCGYRLGNYAQAANDLNTALNLGRQTSGGQLKNYAYAVYSLGYTQFKQQKYNAAIGQFQKVVEQVDASIGIKADAYNRMGDCYLNMRNYDEANENYVKAKATDHSLGDYSMLQQAYIEGLRGNYDKKVQIINQMNAEYAASSLAAKSLYEQGRAYVLSGKTDEAAVTFNSIAMRFPQSEYAQKAREELQTMATNIAMQDSIATAQEALELEAAKAPVLEAQALYEAGQYEQAEQQLNKAIDQGISKPYWLARAFILLSDIYKAEGRDVEAQQTLESLKANYKDDDDIKEMIQQRMK
jgi:tetratricopeptide (TPR) repeat protein